MKLTRRVSLSLLATLLVLVTSLFAVHAAFAHSAGSSLSGVNVYVGYADDLRPNPSFPVPWVGDTATTCVNCTGSPFDSGAIRLDNVTSNPIVISDVSVNVHGTVFDLWGSFTIPPLSTKVLTQTAQYNFDTSDLPIEPCGTKADPSNQPPTVTVTPSGGSAVTFTDSGHILDTFGYDLACQGNESLPWQAIGSPACTKIGLSLTPPTQTDAVGTKATIQGTLSACGTPLPNTTVDFTVSTGPNAGLKGSAVTDSNGLASFSYTSTKDGTDQDVAKVTNVTGGSITSNNVSVIWVVPYLSSGAFVVGDQSASGKVNWWGAQWATSNVLSGGSAPDAFKGFAADLSSNPPTCGGTWTTTPGNSSNPPSTVPAYMAVIVSSNVSKSGSVISGDILHIVVVKTNPGYQPDPGHPGSGTVVTTVC